MGSERHREGTHLGAGLRDRTEVVDHVGLGHADTGIADREDLVLLVRDELDDEVLARVKDGGIGEGGIADFVEGIGGIGDDLTKEDLLVRVEGIWADGTRSAMMGNARDATNSLMMRSRSWEISAWKPKLSVAIVFSERGECGRRRWVFGWRECEKNCKQ